MLFDVKLMEHGSNKIWTIKALRAALPPMGLVEAKHLVDQAPVTIAYNVAASQAEKIRRDFAGTARIEVQPASSPLPKFNRIIVELPAVGPKWVNINDLQVGEIVTVSHSLAVANREELRIITANGAMNFEGKIVATFSDETSYQRLPVGTKVTLTIV